MKKHACIKTLTLAAVMAFVLAACASDSPPEKDPIFDATPGGQAQQGQQRQP